MIDLQLAGNPSAAEQWAFETLVDLARLLPAVPGQASVRGRRTDATATADAAGDVPVSAGMLHQILDLAGAGVEQRCTARDRHGRIPSQANPLVRAQSERTVPVQKLADAFRQAVIAVDRDPVTLGAWPEGKDWAAAFTHDLDVVAGWPLFAGLRGIELLRKGEFRRATRAAGDALGAAFGSPVESAVARIIELEREAGVRSTWFVLAGIPTWDSWRRGDITYRLDAPAARRLLERMTSADHEIGLHGSFATAESGERMQAERALVGRATGREPVGVRQHFLRMAVPGTSRLAADAGFTYDSTHGFADRTGFRLGVADTVGLWDSAAMAPIDLIEAPLVWMDRALSKYQGEEDPDRWVDDALALAQVCREVGGLWVGLWHPNVVPALGFPDALVAYQRLLLSLAHEAPYIAPLQEIVAWRQARRGLRGRRHANGQVELTSETNGTWSVEVQQGNAAPVVTPWPVLGHG